MAAEPLNFRAVSQLNRAVSQRASDSFKADFSGTGWADTPSDDAFVVGRDDESPARQESFPRSDFYRCALVNVFERVVDLPAISRLRLVM